jgi:hypothetical protein
MCKRSNNRSAFAERRERKTQNPQNAPRKRKFHQAKDFLVTSTKDHN